MGDAANDGSGEIQSHSTSSTRKKVSDIHRFLKMIIQMTKFSSNLEDEICDKTIERPAHLQESLYLVINPRGGFKQLTLSLLSNLETTI